MVDLATRLRSRARELGLSDAEVARRSGLTERRYGNYAVGARRPSFETLLRLCQTLDTSPNHLLGYEQTEADDPQRARLGAAWAMLDEDGRRLAVDLLDTLAAHQRRRGTPNPS